MATQSKKGRAVFSADDEGLIYDLVNENSQVLNNNKTNGNAPNIKKEVKLSSINILRERELIYQQEMYSLLDLG